MEDPRKTVAGLAFAETTAIRLSPVRRKAGKKVSPTAAIIDSQSVKTVETSFENTGHDATKSIKGRKPHLLTDTDGLLPGVKVHSADQQDQDGACLLMYLVWQMIRTIRVVFGDSAFGRTALPEFVKQALGWIVQPILRPVATAGFVVLPRGWVVERTIAWIDCCRRHRKDYERFPASGEALFQITMIHLMLKRLNRQNQRFQTRSSTVLNLFSPLFGIDALCEFALWYCYFSRGVRQQLNRPRNPGPEAS